MPGCKYPLGSGIELRHLRYFVAVAEERHFGFAAKRLRVSQPPLSRQIRALEAEIGADLFDRGTRPISLTDAGTAFLEEARFILDQSRRAIERSARTARGERGHLSVAALPWSYHETLPAVIQAFCALVPDVSLELSIREAFDQADALDRRWVDVGFTRPVVGSRAVQVETLLEETMVAIVPQDHRFAKRAKISLEELTQEPFVSIAEQNAPGFAAQQASELARRSLAPAVVLEAPDPPPSSHWSPRASESAYTWRPQTGGATGGWRSYPSRGKPQPPLSRWRGAAMTTASSSVPFSTPPVKWQGRSIPGRDRSRPPSVIAPSYLSGMNGSAFHTTSTNPSRYRVTNSINGASRCSCASGAAAGPRQPPGPRRRRRAAGARWSRSVDHLRHRGPPEVGIQARRAREPARAWPGLVGDRHAARVVERHGGAIASAPHLTAFSA